MSSTRAPSNGTSEPAGAAPGPYAERTHPGTGAVARVWVGDCREVIPRIPECARARVDLIFADPPFNWRRDYDRDGTGRAWKDSLADDEYCDRSEVFCPPGEAKSFTFQWIDLCIRALAPHGSIFINIPDDWAAEIVLRLKHLGLHMVNWCIWHYRFGQNTSSRFISSKVHVLYFCRNLSSRIWRPDEILEVSDRRSIYSDPRTENKRDGSPPGLRLPMDVWYGQYWGRIQGNNKERRHKHDNQLPEVYLERVIRCASEPGMTVLDPFLGSGTTGVVAHALGRHFIGIEYAMENARRSMERIETGPVRVGPEEPRSTALFPPRRTSHAHATLPLMPVTRRV